MAAIGTLTESLWIRHLVAPTATRKFYQPALVKMYCDIAIMEAWLSFHDVTTVQNCEARALDYLELLQVHDLHGCHRALWSDEGWMPHPLIPKGNKNWSQHNNIKLLMGTKCPAEGPRPSRETISALLTWWSPCSLGPRNEANVAININIWHQGIHPVPRTLTVVWRCTYHD